MRNDLNSNIIYNLYESHFDKLMFLKLAVSHLKAQRRARRRVQESSVQCNETVA